jgi:hypothetical protein
MGYSHRFSPCWCRPDSPTGICILAALGGLRLSRDGEGQPGFRLTSPDYRCIVMRILTSKSPITIIRSRSFRW